MAFFSPGVVLGAATRLTQRIEDEREYNRELQEKYEEKVEAAKLVATKALTERKKKDSELIKQANVIFSNSKGKEFLSKVDDETKIMAAEEFIRRKRNESKYKVETFRDDILTKAFMSDKFVNPYKPTIKTAEPVKPVMDLEATQDPKEEQEKISFGRKVLEGVVGKKPTLKTALESIEDPRVRAMAERALAGTSVTEDRDFTPALDETRVIKEPDEEKPLTPSDLERLRKNTVVSLDLGTISPQGEVILSGEAANNKKATNRILNNIGSFAVELGLKQKDYSKALSNLGLISQYLGYEKLNDDQKEEARALGRVKITDWDILRDNALKQVKERGLDNLIKEAVNLDNMLSGKSGDAVAPKGTKGTGDKVPTEPGSEGKGGKPTGTGGKPTITSDVSSRDLDDLISISNKIETLGTQQEKQNSMNEVKERAREIFDALNKEVGGSLPSIGTNEEGQRLYSIQADGKNYLITEVGIGNIKIKPLDKV